MSEKRWHRFRHYQGRLSNFDQIEECQKPKFCCGCEFKHPFCTEQGRVLEVAGEAPTASHRLRA